MRSVSAEWEAVQAEDASPPSYLSAAVVTTQLVAGEDDVVNEWDIDNGTADNAIEASIVAAFDPTRTTMPTETCSVVMTNATNDVIGDAPVTAYDFNDPDVLAKAAYPGRIDLSLGYKFDSGNIESYPMTSQRLDKLKVSDDDLYVTFEGASFTSRLDESMFYGGRFDNLGIPASTLFTEILEDAVFPNEGVWAYTIGDAACKTYAAGTYPLWDASGFNYYDIDPSLDDIMVNIPIPICTHREALVMLAAYCGAYLLHKSDGSLYVTRSLGETGDYHIDIDRVYERPEITQGSQIGTIRGKLYKYVKSTEYGEITSAKLSALDTGSTLYTITHDACEGDDLVLVGATLSGDITYNTYSTTFYATAGGDFTATLSGYPVTIAESRFDLVLDQSGGEVREFVNPITSDASLTLAMYRAYAETEGQYRYRFTMRDDAAIEVGDRVYLDTLAVPDGFPVIVAEIKRSFNGGTDAEYLVYGYSQDAWMQDDMVQTDMIQTGT